MEINWSEFKTFIDSRNLSIQYVVYNNNYHLKGFDGFFELECLIPFDRSLSSDTIDFEDNYKANGNQSIIQNVGTKLERDDIVLKLGRISGQADANGDLILNIIIPGTTGIITRYISGGYVYVDPYTWDSALIKCEVIDVDNIFGFGANTILKQYHDSELATENQGWYFEKSYGTEGSIDIEPLGWYGSLYGGVTLRITFKIEANANIKGLLLWGTVE